VSFDELVSEMVAADLKAAGGERLRVLTPLSESRRASANAFELAGKRVFVAGHTGMAWSAIVRRVLAGTGRSPFQNRPMTVE
jgi:hypothetical protein